MLGLGRASQYAGWWSQGLSMRDTLTFAMGRKFRVADRYYIDASGMTVFDDNNTLYSAVTTGSNITFTGDKNYALQLHAVQFRVGDDWGKDGSGSTPTSFTEMFSNYVNWTDSDNTSQQFDGIVCFFANGNYEFQSNAAEGIRIAPGALPRNTWLTLIVAQNDTPTDFAGWTGPLSNTYNRFFRTMLVNAETGEIIARKDIGAYTGYTYQPDLDVTWQFTFNNNVDRVVQFAIIGNQGNYTYNQQDIQFAAEYHAYGNPLDPAGIYEIFCGTAWPSKITQGSFTPSQALFNIQLPEAGTAQGTPTYAYSITNDVADQLAGTYEVSASSSITSGSPTPPAITLNTRTVDI